MSRSQTPDPGPEPPRPGRPGWSSGGRRRRMWVTVDGGHTRPPVRDASGADEPAEPRPGYSRRSDERRVWEYDAPAGPIPEPEPPAWLRSGRRFADRHAERYEDRGRSGRYERSDPYERPARYECPEPDAGYERTEGYGPSQRYDDAAEPSRDRPYEQPYDQPRDRSYEQPYDQGRETYDRRGERRREHRDTPPPRKLTVTRVAAWRSRQLTGQGVRAFRRAAEADGADRSGLTALTYATMLNYANDAAIAVALANTLFFSAATAESKTKVALYLLITVAPFALIAPVIGPLLDKLQRGRRVALAASFVARAALAVVMAFHFDDWLLYPAALGVMVLSKSFTVLRAAVTPRVLPETITLVTTNSRLTTFGLVAGAVFGGGAAGFAKLTGSTGALVYTAALCVLGAWLCLRIPAWVEVTEGEVPAALRDRPPTARRQPMGARVVVSLWANSAIRVLTGFLMLFVAFAVKAQTEQNPTEQLLLLGVVGAAAGIGGFVGNAVGSRQVFNRSDAVVFGCVGAAVVGAVLAAVFPGITMAAVCALLASTASALAKVCLDAVIQRDLPERSRASAFGRSETVLQLAWVAGGATGVLLPPVYWIGFTTVAVLVALIGAQAVLVSRGASLLPWIRHRGGPAASGTMDR